MSMESIDNLREWWQDRFPVMDRQLGRDFREHIDAIEREVEEVRDREYRNGREDAESAVEFADRLKAAVDRREDVTLFGVDYTPLELVKEHLANRCMTLPLDADGMPWHINDEFEVDEGIAHVNGIGDNRLYYIDNDGMQWTRADNKHHHHAPTVEDVLREFAAQVTNGQHIHGAIEIGQAIAGCAAKLQLREGE